MKEHYHCCYGDTYNRDSRVAASERALPLKIWGETPARVLPIKIGGGALPRSLPIRIGGGALPRVLPLTIAQCPGAR